MKKRLNIAVSAIAAVLISSLLCSCGASAGKMMDSATAEAYDNGAYYAETTAAAYSYAGEGGYDYEMSQEAYEVTADYADNGSAGDPVPVEEYSRKIIKTASLNITAKNATEAYDTYIAKINELGGYEFSINSYANGAYRVVEATIKLPPESLDTAVDYASECGKVTNTEVYSDDITSEYYDTEIRLENKRKNLEKYYELLESARKMEDIIQLQNEIDRITAEIEAAEGQLKLWNSLVNESTLTVRIYEEADPASVSASEDIDWDTITPSEMLQLMGNGFKSVTSGIVKFLQWLLIGIVSISPILIIIFIIIVLIRFRVKRHKKNKVSRIAPASPAPAEEQDITEEKPYSDKKD